MGVLTFASPHCLLCLLLYIPIRWTFTLLSFSSTSPKIYLLFSVSLYWCASLWVISLLLYSTSIILCLALQILCLKIFVEFQLHLVCFHFQIVRFIIFETHLTNFYSLLPHSHIFKIIFYLIKHDHIIFCSWQNIWNFCMSDFVIAADPFPWWFVSKYVLWFWAHWPWNFILWGLLKSVFLWRDSNVASNHTVGAQSGTI